MMIVKTIRGIFCGRLLRFTRRGHLRAVSFQLALSLLLWVPAAQAQDASAYAISIGDALQLDFLDDEVGSYPLVVGGQGEVQLPFLGTMTLAGLRLDAARDQIAATYVERDILLAPLLELSVVDLRPISVVGDVREPGFFEHRSFLTVEQAIGLAGGVIRSGDTEEGRALQRTGLRGDRARIEASMVRVAVEIAGLNVQIAREAEVEAATLDDEDIALADEAMIAGLVARENDIIASERAYYLSEVTLLDRAIVDGRLQIELIDQQIVAQTDQIASYDAELASSTDLADRGLVAAPVLARLLRQVADEETALLRLSTTLASARLQLIALERQRLDLDYRRMQGWLRELPEVELRQTQLRTEMATVLNRIALLEGWSARTSDARARVDPEVTVRRRMPDGTRETVTPAMSDDLLPGDVVIVRLTEGPLPPGFAGGVRP